MGVVCVSCQVHRITAAIQAFEQKLATSDPLAKELEALKKVTQGKRGASELVMMLGLSV